ncbi:MAG: hypothetical protein U0903_10105 [Planctomycetales bacterium]
MEQGCLEEFIDEQKGRGIVFGYYAAGEFLESNAEHELSKEYLMAAATSFDVEDDYCLLATLPLRKRGIKIGKRG